LQRLRWFRFVARSVWGGGSSTTGSGSGGAKSAGGSSASEVASLAVNQTNLVSDQSGKAKITDANLVNAWGLAINPAGPLWVSDNHTGLATVYGDDGTIAPLVVTVPAPTGADGPSAPTGQVFNPSSGFGGDLFIIDTEDGTIAGWKNGTVAKLRVDNSGSGAIYKGLALVGKGSSATLWAATSTPERSTSSTRTTRRSPRKAGTPTRSFRPTMHPSTSPRSAARCTSPYAKQDDKAEDDDPGDGNGYVSVFDPDGTFIKRLISRGALNSPWALAEAPASFGDIGGALVVGNFGNGKINAYEHRQRRPDGPVHEHEGQGHRHRRTLGARLHPERRQRRRRPVVALLHGRSEQGRPRVTRETRRG